MKDAIKSLRSFDASQQQQQQQQTNQQQQQDQPKLDPLSASSNVDCLVSEFLGLEEKGQLSAANNPHFIRRLQAPRTFHMGALLNELKQIDNTSNTQMSTASDWSQEYWSSFAAAFQKQSPMIIDDRAFKWSADYLTPTEATIFDEAYDKLSFFLRPEIGKFLISFYFV